VNVRKIKKEEIVEQELETKEKSGNSWSCGMLVFYGIYEIAILGILVSLMVFYLILVIADRKLNKVGLGKVAGVVGTLNQKILNKIFLYLKKQ